MTNVEIIMICIGLITIFAIIYGPIAAVKVGKELQDRQHSLNRKDAIFTNIMSMRRINLHIDHVKALNMIDVEFASNSPEDKAIRDKWKRYLNHLDDHAQRGKDGERWVKDKDSLFFDLLEVMAKSLSYDIQRSQIERGCYIPQRYIDIDTEQQTFRRCIINLASGINTLKIYNDCEDPTPDSVKKKDAETDENKG